MSLSDASSTSGSAPFWRAADNRIYADLHRFDRFVEQWRGARWQKMVVKVLKLPGGEGALRKLYLMPTDAEVESSQLGLALGQELEEWPGRKVSARDHRSQTSRFIRSLGAAHALTI